MPVMAPDTLHAWRHPRADGAQGRCIGHSDLAVDARRAKRLAHRIRQQARRLALPRRVLSSPLQRSRAVGCWLRRWGWSHQIDPALSELDFGSWDGQPWSTVPAIAIDTWCAHFAGHAPGGGETVAALLQRVRGFNPGPARIVVTHGGWLSAAMWLSQQGTAPPASATWPAAPPHASCTALRWPLPGVPR